MAKKITIPYNGKTYTLEYTRKTVSMMEKRGFNVNMLGSAAATQVPLLFSGAFFANHERVKEETKEAIFGSLNHKDKLVKTLIDMCADAYNTLFEDDEDDEDDEGNPGWAVAE